MIESLIAYMQTIISEHGAWGVFFATLIEEVVAPIPSPIVPLAAGFFLLPASLSFIEIALRGALTIALPVAVGVSIGSTFVYALGFFGGKPVIEKTKKWTGVHWQDIEKIEARLTRGPGDEIVLFVLRMVPIVPGVAISAFSGIVRYPFKEFIVITCLGSFARAFILGVVGWQVGEFYTNYAGLIAQFEKYILSGVLVVLLLSVIIYRIAKKIKPQ